MLEWKILGGYVSAKRAEGYWQIGVSLASGKWHVFGTDENNFPTLDDAKAWCEEQDYTTSQPEIPLPKPGDVWGVVGKPETRRFVQRVTYPFQVLSSVDDSIHFRWVPEKEWSAWVRETGAVELIGDREALVAKMKELESQLAEKIAERDEATAWKRECQNAQAVAKEAIRQRDELRTSLANADERAKELAARVKELEDRLQAAMEERDTLQSRVRELEKNNSSASLWKLECGEAKASADTWKRECEEAQAVAADAIRERDELRKKVAEGGYYALHQKVHDVELELAKVKESRDRLLAGLRRVVLYQKSNMPSDARSVAAECLAKEEGAAS